MQRALSFSGCKVDVPRDPSPNSVTSRTRIHQPSESRQSLPAFGLTCTSRCRYKTKDHWKTSATTPLGEFDIRRDKPLIERFDNKSGMQKKYGLCIRHGKQQKKFQWTSRTEREDMFQELVKWRDQGSTGEILFTGWFTKKGKAAWDGYRRRFFVLTGDQLRYYVSEGVGMGSHQKGTIHIRPSTVIRTKEEEVIITDSMSSDSTSSVKSRTWKLKADGGPDKAEELCRVISERASDAGRRALMNLHTDGPTIDESLMPKTPRGRISAACITYPHHQQSFVFLGLLYTKWHQGTSRKFICSRMHRWV
eukprot:m.782060 g.782060  ORF g.782060 m.782060 type:complete len:307 (-) comp23288_c0_seq6:282-1202(-)